MSWWRPMLVAGTGVYLAGQTSLLYAVLSSWLVWLYLGGTTWLYLFYHTIGGLVHYADSQRFKSGSTSHCGSISRRQIFLRKKNKNTLGCRE
jgi:hypothetical protein